MLALFRIAVRNALRHARHSLAAILSIALGFAAIVLFDGYLTDMRDRQGLMFSSRYMIGDVIIQREGASASDGWEDPFRFALAESDQQVLDALLAERGAEVVTRVRFLALHGLASTGRGGSSFIGLGHDVEEGAVMRGPWAWNTSAGRPLQGAPPGSALLGKGLGKRLDCRPGSDAPYLDGRGIPIEEERPLACRRSRLNLTATTVRGRVNVITPEVVGLVDAGMKELDSRFLLLPLKLAQELADTKVVTRYAVKLADPSRSAEFAQRLTAAAAQRGLSLEVKPWVEHKLGATFRAGVELLAVYRTFVALIVITIAGMSVLTVLMKSVAERTREIGTLRALGFRRRFIVGVFALESALLSALACLVGLALALGVTALVNGANVTYSAGVLSEEIALGVAYSPLAYALAGAFLTSVAVLAAVLPARRASRLGIPDALGHA